MNTKIIYNKMYTCSDSEVLQAIDEFERLIVNNPSEGFFKKRYSYWKDLHFHYSDSMFISMYRYLEPYHKFVRFTHIPYSIIEQALEARRYNLAYKLVTRRHYLLNKVIYRSDLKQCLYIMTFRPSVKDILVSIDKEDDIKSIQEIEKRALNLNLSPLMPIAIIKEVLIRKKTVLTDNDLIRLDKQIRRDDHKIMKFIIYRCRCIDYFNRKDGYTPLGNAIYLKNIELIRFLISNGADPKRKQRCRYTVFETAVMVNDLEVLKEVIKVTGYEKSSKILFDALIHDIDYKIIKFLLENGMDVNCLDTFGSTILIEASKKGKLELVKLFLDLGVNVNAKTVFGETALMSSKNYPEIFKLLLSRGADVRSSDKESYTLFHGVVSHGCLESIEMIFPYYDMDELDCYEKPPLEYADTDETIKFLLEKGAYPNIIIRSPLGPTILAPFSYNPNDLAFIMIQYIVLSGHKQPSAKNSEGYKTNMDIIDGNSSMYEFKLECEKELEKMKTIRLNDKYNLYSFITSKDKILLSTLYNNEIINNLDIEDFKIYKVALKNTINQAVEMRKIFDYVYDLLDLELENTYWNILPYEIKHHIVTLIDKKTIRTMYYKISQ